MSPKGSPRGSRKDDLLSSRELLARIGLSGDLTRDLTGGDGPGNLLGDEPPADLDGDLGAALRERYRLFQERHRFAPGDLVIWKPGLRNRRWPGYRRPAIVLEVLASPVVDSERDSGSPYFNEPLDLVLGLFLGDGPLRGELATYHFDSRRLQPWTED